MISLQLPPGVVASFTSRHIHPEELYPEEQVICQAYEPPRARDFSRGRYCAHQCLFQFGLDHPIRKTSEGPPLWPVGFTGSISHSQHLAGAILAPTTTYCSAGLDIERVGRISPDLWPLLFTGKEIHLLRAQPPEKQPLLSTVLFSAKEAFYKMQFPLTHTGMEPEDLEVSLEAGRLFVTLRKALPCSIKGKCNFSGYDLVGNHVITHVLLTSGRH